MRSGAEYCKSVCCQNRSIETTRPPKVAGNLWKYSFFACVDADDYRFIFEESGVDHESAPLLCMDHAEIAPAQSDQFMSHSDSFLEECMKVCIACP